MRKTSLKMLAVAVAGLGLVGFGQQAQAQGAYSYSCTNAVYGVGGSYTGPSQTYTDRCTGTGAEASTVATDTVVLRAAVSQTSGLIANRIAALTSGSGGNTFAMDSSGFTASSGVASGNGGGVGVWLSGAWSSLEDKSAATNFDGDFYNIMAGIDYQLTNQFLVGLAVGYEDHDYDTFYNSGTLKGDGYTIAPYLAYSLDRNYSLSLSGGYSDIEYDTFRTDPGGVGITARGNTDSERYFIEGRVNAYYPVDLWRIRGSLGILYANEEKDAYIESLSDGSTNAVAADRTELTQLRLNTEWGYEVSPGFIPYLRVGFEYDIDKDDVAVGAGQAEPAVNNEDFGGIFGIGFRFNLDNAITAGIEASTVEFRDDYEEYTVQGNLRVAF